MQWCRSIFVMGAGFGSLAMAAPPAQQQASEIDALVRQLGDESFAARQAAVRRLREIGKPALPTLRTATDGSSDPEIQLRAGELVREIQRPPIPMDTPQPPTPGNGGIYPSSYHADERDGVRTVDASENGRSIHIERYPTNVRMIISGTIAGKPATREYKWRELADLRQVNPEAYALYLAYIHGQEMQADMQARFQAARLQAMQQRAQVLAQMRARGGMMPVVPPMGPGMMPFIPLPPMGIPVPQGNDELNGVEEKVLDDMRGKSLPPPQQDEVMRLFGQLRAARPQIIDPAQIDAQMEEFRRRSAELRKKLNELGVDVPKALPDGK